MWKKENLKGEQCVLESNYNEDEKQTYEENGLFGDQFYAHDDLPAGLKLSSIIYGREFKEYFIISYCMHSESE